MVFNDSMVGVYRLQSRKNATPHRRAYWSEHKLGASWSALSSCATRSASRSPIS